MPLWTNRYVDIGGQVGQTSAIAVDTTGNVLVTGNSFYGSDTIAYSTTGLPLWTNRFDGYLSKMAVDLNGNVLATGDSVSGGYYDYATIKYSNSGVPLWTNYYDGPGNRNDDPYAIAVDSSGNVVVTGLSSGPGYYDYVTIKYSDAGDLLWINTYGATVSSPPPHMGVDTSGNVFVIGILQDVVNYTNSDSLTIKYSADGDLQWINRYHGPANGWNAAVAIAVDSSDNVFVTGQSDPGSATLAYSNAGVPLWTNRSSDVFGRIAVDRTGNVVVTGSSSSDIAALAYSNAGVPLWTNRYHGPADGADYVNAIAVDRIGNVFVTGSSWPNYDWVTIKYSSSIPLPRLDSQLLNNQLVLNWTNAGFNLQTAPAVTGPFTNLPAATSPYTNPLTAPQQFFRLISN